jgi:hypothetical protein
MALSCNLWPLACAPLLRLVADLAARKTAILGGEAYIKAQDLNQSIERVLKAGYKIKDLACGEFWQN